MKNVLRETVPIENVRTSSLTYRPVYSTTDEYEMLKYDIQENGILMDLICRPWKDPETKQIVPGIYELADGAHRLQCAKELGMTTIPIKIDDSLNDDDVLSLQMSANERRLKTKLSDRLHQIVRYITKYPNKSHKEIAEALSMWESEVSNILKLDDKLSKQAKLMLSNGSLKACNAFNLTKIPIDFQDDEVLNNAQKLSGGQFLSYVGDVVKAIKSSNKVDHTKLGPSIKLLSPNQIKAKLEEAKLDYKDVQERHGIEHTLTSYAKGRLNAIEEICSIDETSLAIRASLTVAKMAEKRKQVVERQLKASQEAMENLRKQKEALEAVNS